MMVNVNHGVSGTVWAHVLEKQRQGWEYKTYVSYLLKNQRVYTPGHDYQIHIRPLLGKGSMGEKEEYLLPSAGNCWEITVCDDLRFGRLVTVHCYHPEAVRAMCRVLYEEYRPLYETNVAARNKLEERFACKVINEIFGGV